METRQTEFWTGNFGKEYTDRNPQNVAEWEKLYLNYYGLSRLEMNADFVGNFNRDIKILEVGCNIGLQLLGLKEMGFQNLYGIELQQYAIEKAKPILQGINIIQASGFDIPFKDNYFDIVYTSGVLIHIAPGDLPKIMQEMIRCSKKYIWGFEYYSKEAREINYRGNKGFLWKMDFASEFLKIDARLKEVKRKIYHYITDAEKGNEDIMYLLEIK